jgi:hypothetical protein
MEACGGSIFASKNRLCKVLHISKKGLEEFLSGQEYWLRGNRQYYLISDIAGRITWSMEFSTYGKGYYSSSLRPDLRGMSYGQISNELIKNCNDNIDKKVDYRDPFAKADEICNLLNINSKNFKLYFGDIEFLQIGRKKLYLLNDIAKRIRLNRERT